MDLTQRRHVHLRRLALWCTVLMLLITSLSAFIRLSQAGLGCEAWPQCYGQARLAAQSGEAQSEADGPAVQAARLSHRVIASVALLGVVMMVVLCFASRPWLKREGVLALVLLFLALGLAVLGRWTTGSRVPAVAMGNLLGGVLMLALCWRLAARAQSPAGRTAPLLRPLAALAAVLLLCQLALGALTSASYAGLSCSGAIDCLRSADAAGWQWRMLDPWREPMFSATGLPVNAAGAVTQLVHRAGAALVLLVLLPVVVLALRAGRHRDALTLLALLGLQLLVGVLMVAGALALPLALAHNVIAALMLTVLLRIS